MKVFRIMQAATGVVLWIGPALDALAALDTMAHAAGYRTGPASRTICARAGSTSRKWGRGDGALEVRRILGAAIPETSLRDQPPHQPRNQPRRQP